MITRGTRYATRQLERIGRRKTHPLVRRSIVADYRLIDPLARVNDSRLVARVKVGPRAVLDKCEMIGKALISIGEHSILTGPVLVRAEVSPVTIGKFCSIASEVAMWEANHHTNRASTYFINNMILGNPDYLGDLVSKGPIHVGNDVWIGGRTIVLSGVTIGDGAVIGAGSVVTRDVQSYAIVVGSPATAIGQRFSDQICRQLCELQWWDWDEDKIRRNRCLFQSELTSELLSEIVD